MQLKSGVGGLDDLAKGALAQLEQDDVVERVWAGDHTVWQDDPTEVADRLGWLYVAAEVQSEADELAALAAELSRDGITDVVVMGMGGSSLFPEVIARSFDRGALNLHVVDTTDPAGISNAFASLDPAKTFHIASSKSGSTIETMSQLAYAWSRHPDGRNFGVITDGGSALEAHAESNSFRKVFRNRADIGGRFSALSHFGMVPAALAGVDVSSLLGRAVEMGEQLRSSASANPGAVLGAAMAVAAQHGRDKCTIVLPESLATFGLWLEQLIAESTGKAGTGILPVVGEPLGRPSVYGDDRFFVALGDLSAADRSALDALSADGQPVIDLGPATALDLGREVMRWAFATSIVGRVLGVNPFDQPNVAEAKANTNDVLEAGVPEIELDSLETALERVGAGDYIAILAFIDPADARVAAFERARVVIRDRMRVATTLGVGPRYLHSTGQLHKGGPPSGVFIEVIDTEMPDVEIPGRDYDFATLIKAQAAGDLKTLRDRELRAFRVSSAELAAYGNA